MTNPYHGPVRLLARKLRQHQRHSHSWQETAEALRVNGPDGWPSKGLAFQIAINGYMPTADVLRRLIRDRAIPRLEPEPLQLTWQTRRAIINALKKRNPLPCPDAHTIRQFDRWLACKRPR